VQLFQARDHIVRYLLGALDDKLNIGLRNAAVEALVTIGPDAVPGAIDALKKLELFLDQGAHLPVIMKAGKFHKNAL